MPDVDQRRRTRLGFGGALVLGALLSFFGQTAYGQSQCQGTVTLGGGTVGVPYTILLYAVGGTPPYSNFTLSGMLPPGLNMSAGTTGIVTISGTPTSATGSPFTFSITFLDNNNVLSVPCAFSIAVTGTQAAPSLTVAPGVLNFSGEANSGASQQQNIVLQNPGSGTVTFSAAVLGGSSWISGISPTTGTVTAAAPAAIAVTVNSSVAAGSYRDVIRITSSASSAPTDVPVTLFAANTGPILGVGLQGVRFTMVQGAGSSVTQVVNVTNNGSPGSNVNWTAGPASIAGAPTGNFLAFGSQSGSTSQNNQSQSGQQSSTSQLVLSLNSNASTLSPGTYYELVQVNDPQAQNSPQYVTAVLDVVSAKSISTGAALAPPEPVPAGLTFTGTVGQTVPAQQFTLNMSTTSFVTYSAASSVPPGQNWLTVSPRSGSVSTSVPAVLTVSIKTTGLAAGVYNGKIDISYCTDAACGSAGVVTENITLIMGAPTFSSAVPARPQTARAPAPEPAATANCTPTELVLTETGVPNNFQVPAGWPSNLVANLNDDCGNFISNGSVTASFSDGDAPLTLQFQGTGGQYSATWQPSNQASTIVTLNGASGTLKPATSQLAGAVLKNQAPSLTPNGILHNLNPVVGGALAPGTWAQVYGANLSAFTGTTSGSPIPTQFQNTELIVGGLLAPLYYLSTGQLVAQIPLELTPQQQYPAVGVVNGALTLPTTLSLIPVEPGVLENFTSDALVAEHSDYTFVSAASPAHPGEALTIYLEGMGITNPPVKSGVPAPGLNAGDTLASCVVQPVVKVGGQTAQILFAGLSPGLVGVYQINFYVPASTPTGNATVTITQGTTLANSTVLSVSP